MAGPLVADRVKETSTTTGTGTLTLAGAASGFQGFVAGIGDGNTCFYAIQEQSGTDWEVGVGTVTDAASDTLSRDTIIASSNAGAAVNFGAGTKDVFVSYPGANWGPNHCFTPPVNGDFAWINQGTGTIAQTNGGLLTNDALILADSANASAWDHVIRKKSAPTVPYVITAAMIGIVDPNDGPDGSFGLCFRQSSDGKLHKCEIFHGSEAQTFIGSRKLTNPTTFSADYELQGGTVSRDGLIFLRIADDNTNRVCSFSKDGVNFIDFHSVGRTDFLTADEVGFYVNPYAADVKLTLLSWKET